MTQDAELAEVDPGTVVHGSPLTVDDWWGVQSDDVEGYDLVKEEALYALVGVPFLIYTLTFREGKQQKGIDWVNDYVTAELRVAPDTVIDRQKDRIASRRTGDEVKNRATADPGEQLVINDGSTGFYRQAVQYLEAKSYIHVPEDLPVIGGKNECRYDTPASMWKINPAAPSDCPDVRFGPDGKQVTSFRLPAPLRCMRGLRYSKYSNDFTEEGLTWYIA